MQSGDWVLETNRQAGPLRGGDTGIKIWMVKRRGCEHSQYREQQCKGPEMGVNVAYVRH